MVPMSFSQIESLLVQAILGVPLSKIPTAYQTEVVTDCRNLLADYLLNYFQAYFPPADYIRLKASRRFNGWEIFEKFPHLNQQFDQAWQSFLASLESQLETQTVN
jgi:hypothetical protein